MLVLRNAITRPYWAPTFAYLLKRMKVKGLVRVGGVDRLMGGSHVRTYLIRDREGQPVSWLYLTRRPGWTAWEVSQVWTFPEHRGKGHVQRLYKAAVNHDRLLLASGNLHTQYSQALWRSFIRRKTFHIWAHDFRNLEDTSTVDVEDDELICDLPIYTKPVVGRPPTDVRLLALKKD